MKWMTAFIFIAIFAGHFLYVTRDISISDGNGPWAAYDFDRPKESRLDRYVAPGEYWLGLSYGLAGAFVAFCLVRAIKRRRESLAASAGGLALGGVLWAGICFFVGCCGSPMLPIYLGLLGPKFLGITKPLTLALTILSITIGYRLMLNRQESAGAKNVDTDLYENIGAESGQV